jgi:hypothetical protein
LSSGRRFQVAHRQEVPNLFERSIEFKVPREFLERGRLPQQSDSVAERDGFEPPVPLAGCGKKIAIDSYGM